MKRVAGFVLALFALNVRLNGGTIAVYEGNRSVGRELAAQSSPSIGRIYNQHPVISTSGLGGFVTQSVTTKGAKTVANPIDSSSFQLSTYSKLRFFNPWT